jgi:hypothetical protein
MEFVTNGAVTSYFGSVVYVAAIINSLTYVFLILCSRM